jgi:aspartate-semialdehyde dehydrogenase
MQKKKVGITGANGRVGSVLVNGLKDHYDLKLFTYTPPEGNKYKSLPLPSNSVQNL